MKVLLAGDVDAVKEFVFETSSLPQIRGGSELLLECEEMIRGELKGRYGYEVIYCGGGSFLLEVEAEKAEEVKREIERQYLEITRAATVTIVYEDSPLANVQPCQVEDHWAKRLTEASEEALQAGAFSHRTWTLAAQMREAKTRRTIIPFYEAFPFGRRCDRCGKRMAAYPDRVEADKFLCPICNLRDQRGREKKKQIHGQDIRGNFNQEFWERWGEGYKAQQPEDLDTLLATASRKYLAFLYADGNDIGHLLQKVRFEDAYRALSKALAEGTKQTLYNALQTVCGQALSHQKPWPFDIVNIGGDDVTLLIQAGYAWEVAIKFLEEFEQEVKQRILQALNGSWPEGWPKRITASCGIAIADMKYPIHYLEHLATDLVKEAKKVAKDPANFCSALTFLWLPTPVASERAEPLMGSYTSHPSGDLPCELTARPYTLERAKELLGASREMAKWPRTLRHRWAEALEQGVMTSVNTIHYDIARRAEDKREETYQTLIRIGRLVTPDGNHTNIPAPIWYQIQRNRETIWQTALLDALELAELEAMRPEVEEAE